MATLSIKVNVDDGASDAVRKLIDALSASKIGELNEVGGRAASNAATDFHREFDASGGWRGPRSFESGRSDFGAAVARGWHFETSDNEGATISNNAEHYGFKVRGGMITPKRVSYLTIPLIPEARGRRARDYEIFARLKLFRPKGKDVLMEKTPNGGVRGVYALLKSVTQRPWPDAIPPDGVLGDAFTEGWRLGLSDYIETL